MLEKYYDEFYEKKVKVVTTDGKTFIGIFFTMDRPEDNERGEWSISILVRQSSLVELLESEIKSMESTE